MIGTVRTISFLVAAALPALFPLEVQGQTSPPLVHDNDAPPRIALLIGIADYQHFGDDGKPGQTDLRGPGNDVERMRKALERFGFAGEDVRIVRDAEASKAGFSEAFGWVAERASDPEASVVIYYSGHGSFARDLDGDEADVAPGDTLDEGLVPWDAADIHDPDQIVLDDQIGEWLAAIPTENVTVIIDACYSGTVTRGEVGATPKGPLAPGGPGTALDLATGPGHTLITASSPVEPAYEWRPTGSDLHFGKLTYYLTRALDAADATIRYDDVIRQVREDVAASGSPSQFQTPQLEGARSARLFHVQGDLPRRAYVTVAPAEEGLTIDAGAVHGVRRGALYDVYPAGEMEFRDTLRATIRIEEVDLETSLAMPVDGKEDIPDGGRAVLSRVPVGAERIDRIAVFLEASAEPLADAVRQLDFAHLVADESGANARISKSGEGYVVWVGADSLPPQEGEVEGGLALTEPSGAYRGTPEAICRPLRRAFAIATFEAIENPVDVAGHVDVQLVLTPPDESPSPYISAAPDTVVIGQPYHYWAKIEADEGARYFLTVAIQGYTSEPSVFFPARNAMNQPFPLNQWIRLTGRPLRPVRPAGSEQILALATPTQFDLHSLVESLPGCETTRSRGTGEAELADQPATHWQSFRHHVVITEDG